MCAGSHVSRLRRDQGGRWSQGETLHYKGNKKFPEWKLTDRILRGDLPIPEGYESEGWRDGFKEGSCSGRDPDPYRGYDMDRLGPNFRSRCWHR